MTGLPVTVSRPAVIGDEFRRYDKIIRDIWETFHVLQQGTVAIRLQLRRPHGRSFTLPSLGNGPAKPFSRGDLEGALLHIQTRVNGSRALVFALAATEDYLRFVVHVVLADNPSWILKAHLLKGTPAEVEGRVSERVDQLFRRAAVTSILREEEVAVGFQGQFRTKWDQRVGQYSEINARRNIWIHNHGRVNASYRKFVPNTPYRLGQVASVDAAYLRNALTTARGLCAVAAATVCEHVYKSAPRGKLALRRATFAP